MINVSALLQIAAFIVFVYALWRLTARSVGKILRQRSQRIETGLRTAEENIRDAQEAQCEIEQQLARARAESLGIVESANTAAVAQRQLLVEQAQRDADALVARARDAIGRERQAAVDELRREAGRSAIEAARRVLDRSLDANANHELADRTIADVGRGR